MYIVIFIVLIRYTINFRKKKVNDEKRLQLSAIPKGTAGISYTVYA